MPDPVCRHPIRNVALAAAVIGLCLGRAASGQLLESEVLVVYDSRIADSRAVAEYYAGSANVPGGAGNLPGVRPGVQVFNLANGGQPLATPGNITYPNFIARIRDPIRAHLLASGLQDSIRCLVLTKGLPHRIEDTDAGTIGDNPAAWVNEFNAGDATAASVCSELTLLWQDLSAGEAGGTADSRADGFILNPIWQSTLPATSFTNAHARATDKAWISTVGPGLGWTTSPSPLIPASRKLTPGDIMLVSVLDGHTVADVRAMIDRAQNLVYHVDTAVFVIDESDSDGVANPFANNELDNLGPTTTRLNDDYESARDRLIADGRFDPANVRYNALAGAANFIVGPNVNYSGEGLLVEGPLILLAHFGANHSGPKPGGTAGTTYAESFNYAPGAIFCTMESFNGRAFGGLGPLNQEQAADFIGAGGTFAICHAWEPFANFTPDVDLIVRSFILGNMTWVEAAYTAIPCISWQQIVVGDPLARPMRSIEDIDGNGVVDIEDLHAWTRSPIDLNRSGTADGTDEALLKATIRAWDHFATRR